MSYVFSFSRTPSVEMGRDTGPQMTATLFLKCCRDCELNSQMPAMLTQTHPVVQDDDPTLLQELLRAFMAVPVVCLQKIVGPLNDIHDIVVVLPNIW